MAYRLWSGILRAYGQSVTLRRPAGETALRAFFQPIEEKAPGSAPTALGIAPAGKWLYLGPAEEDLEDVEELLWAGRSFRILRHRLYEAADEPVYRWAVAEERDEAAP